jgi:hypothetical protein
VAYSLPTAFTMGHYIFQYVEGHSPHRQSRSRPRKGNSANGMALTCKFGIQGRHALGRVGPLHSADSLVTSPGLIAEAHDAKFRDKAVGPSLWRQNLPVRIGNALVRFSFITLLDCD